MSLFGHKQAVFNLGDSMSLEILEQLETKIQSAVDTIALLQMEVEELKEKNTALAQEADALRNNSQSLANEQSQFDARARELLSKLASVE